MGLKFPSQRGTPFDSETYRRGLRRIVEAAGIKGHVTAYTLRYSFATLALFSGN